MNKRSLELSQELVAIQGTVLGPAYTQVREQLFGSLTTASQHLDDLRNLSRQRAENLALILKLRSILPLAPGDKHTAGPHFNAPDPGMVRAIQSSTLWSPADMYVGDSKPYYVIGDQRRPKNPRQTELLLVSAMTDATDLKVERFYTDDVSQLKTAQEGLMFTAFSESEITALSDPSHDGDLRIAYNSPGSIRWVYSDMPHFARPGADNALAKKAKILTAGCVPTTDHRDLYLGPTDGELASFGVIEQLGRIATKLGVGDDLQSTLESLANTAE